MRGDSRLRLSSSPLSRKRPPDWGGGMDDHHTQACGDSGAFEDAIRSFEDAWHSRARPEIATYLPADAGPRHPLLIELVHVELELRLKAGEGARVEEYLPRSPALAGDRAAALGLIAAEYELRRRSEPDLGLSDYLARFPD